jgi:phosphatidylserine decarboxylase
LGDHLRNLAAISVASALVDPSDLSADAGPRLPWFKNALIRGFRSRVSESNLGEALEPDARAYPDFNAFFTRALKPEVRPLAPGDRGGVLSGGRRGQPDRPRREPTALLQAKGRTFSLTALLGGDAERARPFRDGAFVTLYLSPRDYHRIHMPLTGQLREPWCMCRASCSASRR